MLWNVRLVTDDGLPRQPGKVTYHLQELPCTEVRKLAPLFAKCRIYRLRAGGQREGDIENRREVGRVAFAGNGASHVDRDDPRRALASRREVCEAAFGKSPQKPRVQRDTAAACAGAECERVGRREQRPREGRFCRRLRSGLGKTPRTGPDRAPTEQAQGRPPLGERRRPVVRRELRDLQLRLLGCAQKVSQSSEAIEVLMGQEEPIGLAHVRAVPPQPKQE